MTLVYQKLSNWKERVS